MKSRNKNSTSPDGAQKSEPVDESKRGCSNSAGQLRALALAIAKGRAFVYVGAGVSASSGLLTWKDLLSYLQEKAMPLIPREDEIAARYFKKIVENSKNLEAGDWLHRLLDNDLEQILWEVFEQNVKDDKLRPSPIHKNLARIPFSMAVTTNYDNLLESAFSSPCSLTWRNTKAVMRAMRHDRFVILHAHGRVGEGPSLILTGRQYRDLMHANPRFGELLRWLLMTRTCLFVGAGLDDPDLIYQLHEAATEYGGNFGPHYALVPYDEAPRLRREILDSNLRIKVIPVCPRKSRGAHPDDQEEFGPRAKTEATALILRNLAGQVAELKWDLGLPQLPNSDDSQFYLKNGLNRLLAQVCRLTGSFRGDVCLPPFETEECSASRNRNCSYLMKYVVNWGPTDPKVEDLEVTPNSICGIAFYKATSERGVYLENVREKKIAEESKVGLFGEIEYQVGHSDVESELAVPIQADGIRIGVLNLESDLVDAYSQGHQAVARKFADKAGRVCAIARERQRRGRRIAGHHVSHAYEKLRDLFSRLRQRVSEPVCDHDLAFLVYQADYEVGKLRAQDPKTTFFANNDRKRHVEVPCFDFGEDQPSSSKKPSLSAIIFSSPKPRVYADCTEAFDKGEITDAHRKALDISGALVGLPIRIHGHVAGVMVAWHLCGPQRTLDGRHVDLFRRAVHLIANASTSPNSDTAKQSSASLRSETPMLPGIDSIRSIIDFLETPEETSSANPTLLNRLGTEFRAKFGSAIRQFLTLLNAQASQFITHQSDRNPPETWVLPTRCRCWVRADPTEGSDLPQLVLALQIQTEKPDEDKNLFSVAKESTIPVPQADRGDPLGVAMTPFPPPRKPEIKEPRSRGQDAAGHEENRPPRVQNATIQVTGIDTPLPVRVFTRNPHLSFLLSRVRVDPFAFVQKPNVLGTDVMAEILDKVRTAPWLVAPVTVTKKEDWAAGDEEDKLEDRFVAFLTFDDPDRKLPEGIRPERSESWTAFQNDLLHEMDLFTAGLSQTNFFSELYPLSKARLVEKKAFAKGGSF